MKMILNGTPEELVAFLERRALSFEDCAPAIPIIVPKVEPPDAEPEKDKPAAQTIAPTAIERMEFGLDSMGAPVDVAAVHRRIGELLRSASFQRYAAAQIPALDNFEPPMVHAKRFLLGLCVRDNLFDLAALDALCAVYVQPQQAPNAVASFSGRAPYTPPRTGSVTVTFEGK